MTCGEKRLKGGIGGATGYPGGGWEKAEEELVRLFGREKNFFEREGTRLPSVFGIFEEVEKERKKNCELGSKRKLERGESCQSEYFDNQALLPFKVRPWLVHGPSLDTK